MPAPWPYPDFVSTATSAEPSWECPEGICVCADHEQTEPVEFSVLLCAADGTRMSNARCRIIVGGRVVNDDQMPNADEQGWVTVVFRRLPPAFLLEWAPSQTPLDPRYPYRIHLITRLEDDDSDESAICRLGHLGLSDGTCVEERVKAFQRLHRYTHITGVLAHVKPELKRYHDESLLPVVSDAPPPPYPPPLASAPDDPTAAQPRPVPTVPDSDPPREPPSRGYQKAGGSRQRGRVTAAGSKFAHIIVALRARFAHDNKLTSRWADDRHLNSMKEARVVLEIPSMNLALTALSPSAGSWHDGDGVTKLLDLAPFHGKSPTGNVDGVITITPSTANMLPRPAGDWHAPVTPADKNTMLAMHHLLLRQVEVGVTIAADGKVLAASNTSATEDTILGGPVVTSCRAMPKGTGNIILVDWRPDFVQGKYTKKKATETVTTRMTTGLDLPTELAADELIVIHQTESARGAIIGSTLNLFTNPGAAGGAHYVIDTDGFAVKVANEETRVTHAGGTFGAAWRGLVSRTARAKTANAKPPANIRAFNNITIGIEHVHGPATGPRVSPGRKSSNTTFTRAQMLASLRLVRLLRRTGLYGLGGVDNIVTHNQIYLTDANALGDKPNCPGAGYEWEMLEAKGAEFARKTRNTYAFNSPADKAIQQYLNANTVIDSAANGKGHLKHLQEALETCGYFVSRANVHTDAYDSGTIEALRACILRHFSGPTRAGLRSQVVGSAGEPIVNELLVMTLLASAEDT